MNFLYNCGIRLYNAAIIAVSPFHAKAAKMITGRKETFSVLAAKLTPGRQRVWIHAASLGEFEQGRPLIERIRAERPDLEIVLTFFSPSGFEVRKNYDGADAVVYLPADTPKNARRLLDTINPVAVVFVKYEFWGNFLSEINRRDIPLFLISSIFRPQQIFFKPWGGCFRKLLRCFTAIFTQDDASTRLISPLTESEVTTTGDTRFDRVSQICDSAITTPALEEFTAAAPGPILIAGSSWPQDEDIYMPWVNKQPGVRLIIAPHEFNAERIEKLRKRINGKCVTLSEIESGKTSADDAKCVIIDCFGRLSGLYRYADIALIGGGFGAGIHNILEAGVYGMPVVFGPNYHRFKEAVDMIACGGGFTFDSPAAFERIMSSLTIPEERKKAGDAATAYIKTGLGATDKIWDTVSRHLPDND